MQGKIRERLKKRQVDSVKPKDTVIKLNKKKKESSGSKESCVLGFKMPQRKHCSCGLTAVSKVCPALGL